MYDVDGRRSWSRSNKPSGDGLGEGHRRNGKERDVRGPVADDGLGIAIAAPSRQGHDQGRSARGPRVGFQPQRPLLVNGKPLRRPYICLCLAARNRDVT